MVDPALLTLVQRLERDPEDADALTAAWIWLDERGEHQTLAVLAEKVASRTKDPKAAAVLHARGGEVWARSVGRIDRAVTQWERALALDPDLAPALEGLAAAHVRDGKDKLAEPLLQRLLDMDPAPRRRAAVLTELAALRGRLGDLDGQIVALEGLLKLAGPGAPSLEARRSIARLLVQRSRASTDPETSARDAHAAAHQLGAIAREGASGRDADFAEAALDLDPGEPSAFVVMEEHLRRAGREADLLSRRIQFVSTAPLDPLAHRVRSDLVQTYLTIGQVDHAIAVLEPMRRTDPAAADRLAALYAATGRSRQLAELLAEAPLEDTVEGRVATLRRRALLLKSAGDPDGGIAAYRELLKEAPADSEAIAVIESELKTKGEHGALRNLWMTAARSGSGDPDDRIRMLQDAALMAERQLEDLEGAVEAWELVGASDSDAAGQSLDALLRLYPRLQRWERMLEVLAWAARATDEPQARRKLLLQWAEVRRDHEPDPSAEADVLSRMWGEDQDDDTVTRLLLDAKRRAGDVAGITEILRGRADRAAAGTAGPRWAQLAEHLEAAGDSEGALDAWRASRKADPTQAMAWHGEERLLEGTGRRGELVDALIAHADHPLAAGRQAGDLYARAARIAADLGDGPRAATLAQRALRFMPEDPALQTLAAAFAPPVMESSNEEAVTLLPPAPVTLEPPAPVAASTAVTETTLAEALDAGHVDDPTGIVLIPPMEEPDTAVPHADDLPVGSKTAEVLAVAPLHHDEVTGEIAVVEEVEEHAGDVTQEIPVMTASPVVVAPVVEDPTPRDSFDTVESPTGRHAIPAGLRANAPESLPPAPPPSPPEPPAVIAPKAPPPAEAPAERRRSTLPAALPPRIVRPVVKAPTPPVMPPPRDEVTPPMGSRHPKDLAPMRPVDPIEPETPVHGLRIPEPAPLPAVTASDEASIIIDDSMFVEPLPTVPSPTPALPPPARPSQAPPAPPPLLGPLPPLPMVQPLAPLVPLTGGAWSPAAGPAPLPPLMGGPWAAPSQTPMIAPVLDAPSPAASAPSLAPLAPPAVPSPGPAATQSPASGRPYQKIMGRMFEQALATRPGGR